MKINWKVRFRSTSFVMALLALIGLAVTDAGIVDTGTYETYVQAILLVLTAGGIVIDPTTQGISDSKQARRYAKPRKDV